MKTSILLATACATTSSAAYIAVGSKYAHNYQIESRSLKQDLQNPSNNNQNPPSDNPHSPLAHDGGSAANAGNGTAATNSTSGAPQLHASYMLALVCVAGLL